MNLKGLFLVFSLACMWGPSFLFIKLAVEDFSPITVAAGRISIGAVFLFILVKWKGRSLPAWGPLWGKFFVMGAFANSLPFILFAYGEQYISSALGGVINGSTPIATAALAHFFLDDESMTWRKGIGIALGLSGFLLLLSYSLADGSFDADSAGILAVGLASFAYAVAMVYGRSCLPKLEPFVGPAAQLGISSLYMLPLAWMMEGGVFMEMRDFPWQGILSLAALGVMGTGIAFVIYYRILETQGATSLAMTLYLVPVFGIFLGYFLLGEELKPASYLATLMILLGMVIVQGKKKPQRAIRT